MLGKSKYDWIMIDMEQKVLKEIKRCLWYS